MTYFFIARAATKTTTDLSPPHHLTRSPLASAVRRADGCTTSTPAVLPASTPMSRHGAKQITRRTQSPRRRSGAARERFLGLTLLAGIKLGRTRWLAPRLELPLMLQKDQATSSRQSSYWIPRHRNTTTLILMVNLNGRVEEDIAN